MKNAKGKTTVTPQYRTFALLLLTLVYGFNFIDRQIVGILAPWIQADLGLTNTQLGLLVGLAFAAFYTIMGIPLAFLADRMNRVTLLSLALAVWSGFTALTGVAQNFVHIALPFHDFGLLCQGRTRRRAWYLFTRYSARDYGGLLPDGGSFGL